MKNSLCIKASSFLYPCDLCMGETTPLPTDTGWRALASSRACVLDGNGHNTGYVHVATLEEYNLVSGVATANTKPNVATDANYIADYQDTTLCQLPAQNVDYSIQAIMQDGGNGKFTYIITLASAFSVPVTVTINAQYRQNNVNRAAAAPPVTIPAGKTVYQVVGDNYDTNLGAITEYHTQISSISPPSPDGKNVTLLPYDGNNNSNSPV
ncbi:hypothetical protein [Mucilaginibacter ginkgonis]|uniref:Uncharacterized protein n=1 Tax=Mucilaginibacter ginkgonis TaxID=2682091 RepID=A0A7T7FD03_9SPHI|nr:hypothetical protein [Mucilaginibacter ginkgonis]QQL51093.1 hypothetical protein GO620_006485 [Mucilaginibacter ginkgonis]